MTALLLKPFGILIYAGFGGLYLSAASVREKFVTTMTSRAGLILAALLVGGAISLLMLFAIAGSYRLVSAVAIGTAGFAVIHFDSRSFLALFSAFAAVTLVMSLAWWRIEPSPASALPLAAFAAILGGMTLAFSGAGKSRSSAIPLAVFLLAGFLLQIDLGGYRPGQPITFYLAHHWGAYIGPALHLRSGLIPFYDMPLQYGLGPTLTIAASCHGTDCWTGMECFGIAFDLACGALILRMVLATSVPRGSMWQSAATVVVFAAVFLWPGAAAEGSGLLAQPNVGGIRFLPVTLVAFLLFFGRPTSAAAAMIPALLWSPSPPPCPSSSLVFARPRVSALSPRCYAAAAWWRSPPLALSCPTGRYLAFGWIRSRSWNTYFTFPGRCRSTRSATRFCLSRYSVSAAG